MFDNKKLVEYIIEHAHSDTVFSHLDSNRVTLIDMKNYS